MNDLRAAAATLSDLALHAGHGNLTGAALAVRAAIAASDTSRASLPCPCDDAKLIREQLLYDAASGEMRIARSGKGLVSGRVVGSLSSHGYVLYRFNGRSHRLHRLVWLHVYGQWPSYEIDHINGVKNDNRIANLRDVSRHVNMQNKRVAISTSKSKVLGVFFRKDKKKWSALIRFNGQKKHLGYFRSVEEASDAYLKAKRQLHEGCTI